MATPPKLNRQIAEHLGEAHHLTLEGVVAGLFRLEHQRAGQQLLQDLPRLLWVPAQDASPIDQLTAHYSSQLQHPDEVVWKEDAKDMMAFFDLLRNPNLEIEIKAKDRHSKGPPKRILLKTYRRRKGVRPVPVKDSIAKFEREAKSGAATRVGPRLVDSSDLPDFLGPVATGERRRAEGTGFLGPLRG